VSAKKPLIFLGVFIALALFYYFYEYKGGEVRKTREELKKKAIVFSADSVDSFSIVSRPEKEKEPAGLDTVSLKHSAYGWRIIMPLEAAADSESVARLLHAAAGAETDRVVEDSAAELSIFGLDKPNLVFEVSPAGSPASLKLLLGNKNPTESYIYAVNAAQPHRVVLVNSWILSDLNKSLHDLRDKKVLHLDKDRVNKLVIEEKGTERLKLEKAADGWYLDTPLRAAADQDSVKGLLDELAGAEAVRFIDSLREGESYGLEPAELTARIYEEEGEAVRTLFIGSRDTSGSYFARREGMENVYLVKEELRNQLIKNSASLRSRALVRETKDSIKLVSLITPGGTVAAFKDSAGVWRLSEPDSTRADGPAVDGFLWDLKDLRALKFIDQPAPEIESSFKTPFLEIVYTWEEKEKHLTFARLPSESQDSLVYVRANGIPGTVAVDSAEAVKLVKSFHDLRYKKIIDLDTNEITRIRLDYPDKQFELAKEKDDWRIVAPQSMEAKSWKVQNILWDLTGMDFKQVISETGEDSSRYGFDRPGLRVVLTKDKNAAAVFTFADSIPGSEEQALRLSGDKRIFGVEKRVFQGLPASLDELKKE